MTPRKKQRNYGPAAEFHLKYMINKQEEYMGLQQEIESQLVEAIKSKDKERAGAIRILKGEFQRQPEKELNDDQVVAIIKKLIKSERELLEASKQQDSAYITILQQYLPKQATDEDVRAWIKENIDFNSFANKMQAMRPIMAHFGSTVDGAVVKKILQDMG